MNDARKRGFTLVEIIVVLGIIVTLSSGLTAYYTRFQGRACDVMVRSEQWKLRAALMARTTVSGQGPKEMRELMDAGLVDLHPWAGGNGELVRSPFVHEVAVRLGEGEGTASYFYGVESSLTAAGSYEHDRESRNWHYVCDGQGSIVDVIPERVPGGGQ